jgi:hypothetical protein
VSSPGLLGSTLPGGTKRSAVKTDHLVRIAAEPDEVFVSSLELLAAEKLCDEIVGGTVAPRFPLRLAYTNPRSPSIRRSSGE